MRAWGGLVVLLGPLATGWQLPAPLDTPREQVRSFQELALNLLHYAYDRRHLRQLQTIADAPPPRRPATLSDRAPQEPLL
jgi:hypothetical protein